MIVENIFLDRSDKINFCAEIMHRNLPPPNLCNLRPPLTIMLGRGCLTIPGVEVSRERPLLSWAENILCDAGVLSVSPQRLWAKDT